MPTTTQMMFEGIKKECLQIHLVLESNIKCLHGTNILISRDPCANKATKLSLRLGGDVVTALHR